MRLFGQEEGTRNGEEDQTSWGIPSTKASDRGELKLLITGPSTGDTAARWLLVDGQSNIAEIRLSRIRLQLRSQTSRRIRASPTLPLHAPCSMGRSRQTLSRRLVRFHAGLGRGSRALKLTLQRPPFTTLAPLRAASSCGKWGSPGKAAQVLRCCRPCCP